MKLVGFGFVILHISLAQSGSLVSESPGCRAPSLLRSGLHAASIDWAGDARPYNLQIPSNVSSPLPLVINFHGWGGDRNSRNNRMWSTLGAREGFVSVHPSAPLDCPAGSWRCSRWASWNGFGSTSSPGPDGPTCDFERHRNNFCYASCGTCGDPCWWTTCRDTVDFALKLLAQVQAQVCIDMSRVYAAGCSNGGMFLYELASDSRTANLFAGYAPMIGLPHNGFNVGPMGKAPPVLIGQWGTRDRTVPPFSNTNDPTKSKQTNDPGGWYYSTARNTTDAWARRGHCTGWVNWSTPVPPLVQCQTAVGCEENAQVVKCFFPGGHVCSLPFMGKLAWSVLARHQLGVEAGAAGMNSSSGTGGLACTTKDRGQHDCVFPFMYQGAEYGSCTAIDNLEQPWCSTTGNYDSNPAGWGACPNTTFCNTGVKGNDRNSSTSVGGDGDAGNGNSSRSGDGGEENDDIPRNESSSANMSNGTHKTHSGMHPGAAAALQNHDGIGAGLIIACLFAGLALLVVVIIVGLRFSSRHGPKALSGATQPSGMIELPDHTAENEESRINSTENEDFKLLKDASL